VGVGTDLVHVPRLADALAQHPGFAARVFTRGEIAYCERHRQPAPRYAARFAAKEAVLKALGTGLGRGMRWHDVEIVAGPNREPLVRLHGEVATRARALGIVAVDVSLSHDGEYALAFAVTRPSDGAGPSAAGSPAGGV
jgi:holo-[acyl-carrier protein] synthase